MRRRRPARARRRSARARSWATWSSTTNGPPCPGSCPNRGCLEAFVSGDGARRGRRAGRRGGARERARTGAGRGSRRSRARSSPSWRTTATRWRATLIERCGRHLGIGITSLVNIFNPAVVVVGGGVIAAGDCCSEPARAVVAQRALWPCPGRRARSSPPRFGAGVGDARGRDAGPRGRGAAHGVLARAGRTRAMSPGRLVVCPTPIGNLEDVTLRVLSALRDADVVACEDTRRTRVLLDRYGVDATLVSYHEHNERGRAAELVGRMRDGAVVALVTDAGMPLVSDPGFVLVQACVAAGLAVEVLPGPERGARGARGQRAAGRQLAVRGVPAAQGLRGGCGVFASPETVVAFESPGRVGGLAAVAGGHRSRPPGRGVPRAHEAARGGRARDRRAISPRATARRRRGARSCSSSRGAPAGGPDADLETAVDALVRLVEAGREAAAGGGRRRGAHRAHGQRPVPRLDRLTVLGAARSRPGRPRRSAARSRRARAGRW